MNREIDNNIIFIFLFILTFYGLYIIKCNKGMYESYSEIAFLNFP